MQENLRSPDSGPYWFAEAEELDDSIERLKAAMADLNRTVDMLNDATDDESSKPSVEFWRHELDDQIESLKDLRKYLKRISR